jgi:electron transfer flavoprotein alpha subunit
MNGVLVVLEYRGSWNRMSWEALAAGQEIAAQLNQPLMAAVAGSSLQEAVKDLAGRRIARAFAVRHQLLREYTPGGFTGAFQQLIQSLDPMLVLFPHTYQVRDFAPGLATRFEQTLIADVIATRLESGRPVFVRQLLQGKLNADYVHNGVGPCFASLQAGAFRADTLTSGVCSVEEFVPRLEASQIRSQPGERFRESAQTVDLSAASLIVSVGRGGKYSDCPGTGHHVGRRACCLPAYLRQRVASHGASGGQLRPDSFAQGVHRCRHFRGDPTPGRDEGIEGGNRDQ